jgi:hypothetical protein
MWPRNQCEQYEEKNFLLRIKCRFFGHPASISEFTCFIDVHMLAMVTSIFHYSNSIEVAKKLLCEMMRRQEAELLTV